MTKFYNFLTKKALLSLLIVLFSMAGFSATYYVSNTGSDSNSGLSESAPWKTISKVRATTFMAGDVILLKSGDVFTDATFAIFSSGSISNRITVSSYGGAAKPEIRGYGEISGWKTSGNWALYSSGIYRMALSTKCARIWINGADKKESQTLALDSNHPWRYEGGYLYVKASSNPATYYKSMIIGNRKYNTVGFSNVSNIIFKNIKVTGGATTFSIQNCKNITVDNCEIADKVDQYGIWISGTSSATSENVVISNNIINTGDSLYYTYFRGFCSTYDGINMGGGVINSKIHNNYFYGWGHSAIYLINLNNSLPFHDNEVYNNFITAPLIDYARGFGVDHTISGYNNSFHDNTIVNTTVRVQLNANGFKFYNNIIDGTKGCPYPEKQKVGNGIAIEGYNSACPATKMEIYNNTIRNCAEEGILITWYNSTEKSYINIHDNNIFNNGTTNKYQLWIWTNSPSVHHNTFSNNHLYHASSVQSVQYSSKALTPALFNSQVPTNGDVINGNDAILTYKIPGLGSYVTNINDLRIIYNTNKTPLTTALNVPMIDLKGVKYTSSITLQPYTSVILLKDNSPTSVTPGSPSIYNVTGGGSFASGGSGVPVGLSNSQIGVNYQVKLDGINNGNVVVGNGSALSFGNKTVSGVYTVVATHVSSGVSINMAGSATVTITGSSSSTPILVTGVSVSPLSASVSLNGTQQLSATVLPSNATNKSVSWSSNNTAVATVSSTGMVTGVGAGSATISVRTLDGSKIATSTITVVSSTSSGSGSVLGLNSIGGMSETGVSGHFIASSFKASSNMTVNRLSLYVGQASGYARLGIYTSNSAGEPGTLLAQTGSLPLTTGWNSGTLASSQNLVAGVTYWLAFEVSSSLTQPRYNSSYGRSRYKAMTYGPMPTTAPLSSSIGTGIYSIYADNNGLKNANFGGITTEIEDLSGLVKIDVFPNPSVGKVTIRFSELPIEGSRIEIVDLSGRRIISKLITNTSEDINLDQEPPGIYLVKTTMDTIETIHKLVIN